MMPIKILSSCLWSLQSAAAFTEVTIRPWLSTSLRTTLLTERIKTVRRSSEDEQDWGEPIQNVSENVFKKQVSVPDGNKQERDLFIPIFSIVSLAGLFGAYGYEMLRLYLRGELYLPWN